MGFHSNQVKIKTCLEISWLILSEAKIPQHTSMLSKCDFLRWFKMSVLFLPQIKGALSSCRSSEHTGISLCTLEKLSHWPGTIKPAALQGGYRAIPPSCIYANSSNATYCAMKHRRSSGMGTVLQPCPRLLPPHRQPWMKAEFSVTMNWFYPLRG